MEKSKKKNKRKIQKLDVKNDNWDTGMFPIMSDDQIIDVLEYTLAGLTQRIIELKKELGWDTFIDDVGRKQIAFELHKQVKERLKK